MLLSLDKTISFHLYFKESKFGKNSTKHGGRRKPSQKNMKGKDKKHLTFFWFGVKDKGSGGIIRTQERQNNLLAQ